MQLQRLRLVLSSSLRSLTSLPKPGAFLLNPITKYQQRKSAFTRHQVHEDGRVTHQDGTAVSALAESVHLATRLAGAFVSEPPNSGQIAVDLTNQLYSLERIEEKIRRRSSTEYIVSFGAREGLFGTLLNLQPGADNSTSLLLGC